MMKKMHFLRGGFLVLMLATLVGVPTATAATPGNDITVKSFNYDRNSQNAIIERVNDPRTQQPCALIVITNEGNLDGFIFNTGVNHSQATSTTDASGRKIVKLWVSPNTKRMTISHTNDAIGALRNYDFGGNNLVPGGYYTMELGYVTVPNALDRQYAEFNITPPQGAYLEVEGEPWPVDQTGYAAKSLPFGTYQYLITSPDAHEEAGEFVLNSSNENKKINVALRPNYGWFTLVGDNLTDADIFINQTRYGASQLNNMKLRSGQYTLKISRPLYRPYTETFTIADNQELRLTPSFEGNYATVTITAPDGAAILINGEKKGEGTWTGPLEPSTYSLEAARAGHMSSHTTLEVTEINREYNVTMTAPQPMNGRLEIESNPRGANIIIDGQPIGHTTPHTKELLMGQHTIELQYPGYQPYRETVNVEYNQVKKLAAQLSNNYILSLSWTPADATLLIDGEGPNGIKVTHSPYSREFAPNTHHTITIVGSGYHTKYDDVFMDRNISKHIDLKEIVHHDYDGWGHCDGDDWDIQRFFYMSAMGTLGNIKSAGFTCGFVYKLFNMQFDFGYSFNDEISLHGYYSSDTYSDSSYYEIKPSFYYGGRIGLAFQAGRIMITPQVGYQQIKLDKTWVGCGLASARFQIRTSSHFAFVLSPEYYFAVQKGDLFKLAADKYDDVKKLGTGFRIGAGFELYF